MRNMKISTEKLAQICGVSQGTVDRALNDRDGISKETKQKIIDAAIKYGYRPLRDKGLCGHIGIVIFDLNNEYLTTLVTELEAELRCLGYCSTVMFSHFDQEYEIECIKKLYISGVDGIILFSVNSGESFVNFITSISIPVVCVGNKIDGIPYVGIDDRAAMRSMVKYVAEKNYEKIIYFSPALEYPDAFAQILRYKGFLDVMAKKSNFSVATKLDQISITENQKTAIICSTDYYALKVYFSGIKSDIFGFDNIKMIEKYSLPIKSVDYSVKEIAKGAVKQVISNNKADIIVRYKI
jgi:DNA-binding LacI/PurR family transcriptional regulator